MLSSFFLALFLWVLVTLNQTYETRLDYPIQIRDIPEDIQVVEMPTRKLEVTVRSNGLSLLTHHLRLRRDTLFIPYHQDFSQQDYAPSAAFQAALQAQLGSDLKIDHLWPDRILLQSEQKVSKMVPLRLAAQIRLKPAFQLLSPPQLTEDSVRLLGPRQVLDTIESWSTVSSPTPVISEPCVLQVQVVDTLPNLTVTPKVVGVSVNPRRYTEVRVHVPVEVQNVPKGTTVRLDRSRLEVSCLFPIDEYQAAKDTQGTFHARIAFADLDPYFPHVVPELTLPPAAKLISAYPPELSFVIVEQ